MFTSCFRNWKAVKASGLEPVAISRGLPAWFKGRQFEPLCPSRDMLQLADEEFDREYDRMLAQLDPRQVFEALGDRTVLLCWEKPNQPCHRRNAAEWL